MSTETNIPDGIAIIGMSGRFPGAANVDSFWNNLVAGHDSITRFSENETEFSVATEAALARGEKFVRARGLLENVDQFDADFFGMHPREAEITDPQHRIFLECAWEALEMAGYDPAVYDKLIGIYAGLSLNTYLLYNLCSGNDFSVRLAGNYQVGEYPAMLGNDKDFLPTRIAYKMNLRGPAMAIQCACSTSLVAICQAVTALQSYQCDMALAGGVSISFPQYRDYRYEEDGMVSPDGTCRAFDADAKGTVFGHGSAVVLLKRLSEARADGDNILAVIRGCAVNNDGSDKIGYAAPGLNAQAEVISTAQAVAGVNPESISYIETHGTGTPLGDPIEVAALTKAFRESGANAHGFCALGTAKTHIGHLDVAAGATGLIKTVLQLQHDLIPSLLHFKAPNPRIDFASTPFAPVTSPMPWKRGLSPRRAGVSAFGVGGTNAHVIVEEAPEVLKSPSLRKNHLLVLSARTPTALDAMVKNLATHLETHPELDIADVAFTLAKGRRSFKCRHAYIVADLKSAIDVLRHAKFYTPDMQESILADHWMAGEAPNWDTYFSGEFRRRIPLPTYPFERKSFWIKPAGEKVPANDSYPPSEENVQQEISPEFLLDPKERRGELVKELLHILEELSGSTIADQDVKFSDLGFDSLFLTQVSQAISSRYGMKVTFRQLLNEVSSITRLSAYLDATLPSDAVSVKFTPPKKEGHASALSSVKWPEKQKAPSKESNQRFGPYKPITQGGNAELTPRQRKALDDLIVRYTRRTAGSKRYAAEHRPHYADPRAVSGFQSLWKEMVYPIVSSRSKGGTIWDIDENAYVDITMGFGTYFFGHSPDWLVEALQKQMQHGIEIGPQSAAAGGIARDICEFTGMERATFCNTGSEAVMAAIRLARTVTGRTRIVYFTGDYHGMFDEVLVRGSWINGEYRAQPIAPGIPQSLVENMLVLDYAAPESLEILRRHAGEIAAVLVEPVQSRRPGFQPKSFMRELRSFTERSGAALIFDEIVTGFRCHPGGAQAYFGVQADMATYGKVVGGGIPIGILAGKRRFMDALDGGMWNYGDDSIPEAGMTFFAGTFVRHPMAMAAARAVIDHLREKGPGLQLRMAERTALLCRTLNDYFERVQAPIRMPYFSAFSVIEHPSDLPHISLLWYYLREKGIHIWEHRPIYLTLAHTDKDFDAIIRAFQDSVAEMQDAGFLPLPSAAVESTGLLKEFPRLDAAPTTEAQREIWASVQMGDDANRAYNESNTIEFNGSLDQPALKKALLLIIQRHAALRSTFSQDGRQQFFQPASEHLELSIIDLSQMSSESRDLRYSELREEGTGIPFDLVSGPLLRLQLLILGAKSHALIISAHHMICDGWSFGMIVDELSKSYNAFRNSRLPMLPPPLAFGDYARDFQQKSVDGDKDKDYWISQFQGNPPVLELPTDHPRPPLKSYAGAMEVRELDDVTFSKLKDAIPSLGGTLFVNLLSAFATLLHRFSGQSELVIGVPSAGQTLAGCDELIGHCLNFLPLRLCCEGTQSFREFSATVGNAVMDAYEHQSYTFGSLVRALKLPRDTSRLPLVSVMFNIDKSGYEHLHFDGLDFRVLTNAKQFVNFDLFFNLVQSANRLEIECEYNTDIYDKETIRHWLASFEALIGDIISRNDIPLSDLSIVNEEDRFKLLHTWNDTACAYPSDQSVHSLIAEMARAYPDKIAVRCLDSSLTYGELDLRSNKLASHLSSLGVKAADSVGIFTERSIEMIIGLMGILKCGAIYVPMDPMFPQERLQFMVEDADLTALLTQTPLADRLPAHNAKVVLLDQPLPDAAHEFFPSTSGGEHPAYIIFTSGSTGRPKGVVIPHRALVNLLSSMRKKPGLESKDILFSVTTLSFDISGLEIFLPLTTGATVIIATNDVVIDGNLLCAALDRSSATVMQATPATWRLLLEAGWKGNSGLKILIGGEAVPRELVHRLLPLCDSLWNVYGPTETTIWSTTVRLKDEDQFISIGMPIDNTQVYIANSSLQLQPVGVYGELLIGGEGVALGYHNRNELTQEKFISDSFGGKSFGRLYRTGDLARRKNDGLLECAGRMDTQVKIRGYRIELGEIESLLEKHQYVNQSAVAGRDDTLGNKRLVAYIVLNNKEGNENSKSVIRDYLKSQLPAYMIPSVIVFLEKLPLTPNGKVDRKALPNLQSGMEIRENFVSFIPPGSRNEVILANIWKDILGVDRIGIHDDIFELGADSITIFQITARAATEGFRVSPADIFRYRTIAELLSHVEIEKAKVEIASIRRLDRSAYRRKS